MDDRHIRAIKRTLLSRKEACGKTCGGIVSSESMRTKEQLLEAIVEYCDKEQLSVVSLEDEQYPEYLRNIYDPPQLLYVKGELQRAAQIAIVGTRAASRCGRQRAFLAGRTIAGGGVTVCSGLAFGIDIEAHLGAVSAGRSTAVLAGGLSVIYPVEHSLYARLIVERGGALVSESHPFSPPAPWKFVKRNRIISGLCSAVCLIEAPKRSGAVITADYALSEGRELYCDGVCRSEAGTLLKEQGAVSIIDYTAVLSRQNSDGTMGCHAHRLSVVHGRRFYP